MADHLLVTDGGLFSTIQDAGRFGYQRFGISASGAMDRDLLAIASALAGNDLGAAAIEMTLAGPAFTVEAEGCRIAVAGDIALAVDGEAAACWRAHDLRRGAHVRLGAVRSGMRAYLAIAGGFAIEPVLGSLSTHTRSRIGGLDGGPLKAGDRLPLDAAPAGGPCLRLDPRRLPEREGPIRVMLGPQADAFTAAGIATFLASPYTISAKADRMGCQLEGPEIEHSAGFNIVSDGIMNGSVQVPGHGRPIVLLADRQTTGGYPKIATVIGPDLARLAQCRPGEVIRFEQVSAGEAEALARRHREALDAALAAIEPALRDAASLSPWQLLELNLVGGVVSGTGDPFAHDHP